MQGHCDAAVASHDKAQQAADAAAVMHNPNFPFPARPPHAAGAAHLRTPIGCLWRPSVRCGPPLVVAEGARGTAHARAVIRDRRGVAYCFSGCARVACLDRTPCPRHCTVWAPVMADSYAAKHSQD